METTETTRLRALCATIPEGDAVPCCADAGLSHPRSWSLGTSPMGALVRAWVDGPVQLLAEARTAIPALCDALEAREAERDSALEECDGLRRGRDHGDIVIDETCAILGAAADEGAVVAAQRVTAERDGLLAQLTAERQRAEAAEARAVRARASGAVTAWQAAPDAPGLWWRYEGSAAPVLCYAVTQPLGVYGAYEIARTSRWHDPVPREGVTWTRCVPPDDAPQTDPPPRCTTTHYAGCACHEARRDAEVTALRARVEALETALRDARADHTAAEEYLAGIVRRWERVGDVSQGLANLHVPGLRAEIEEARDGREGRWRETR